jgi:Pyridoxamine 5'-phosphate oxidase
MGSAGARLGGRQMHVFQFPAVRNRRIDDVTKVTEGMDVARIEGAVREVVDKCEWVAIATAGPDGPHLAATWGDYVRALGFDNDLVFIPAGGLRQTEANLKANPRIELLVASRQIARAQGNGQGCVLSGTAEMQTSGPAMEKVKARFPWARAVLVVSVERAATQL